MNNIKTKEIINSLFVDVFNSILYLEDNFISDRINERVTVNEVHVMEAILLSEKKSMGAIAKKLMVTEGTLTTSVNKLIAKGFISKVRDEIDKRVYLLDLTDNADEVMEVHKEFHDRMMNHVIDNPNIDEKLVESLESLKLFFNQLKDEYKK